MKKNEWMQKFCEKRWFPKRGNFADCEIIIRIAYVARSLSIVVSVMVKLARYLV